MAFSIMMVERIQNKLVKENSVGVLLGVLIKQCNIFSIKAEKIVKEQEQKT